MNCNETSQRLELLVLNALSPEEAQAAAEHVATCPACRAAKERLDALVRQVQMAAPSVACAGLAARIAQAARAELAASPARRVWPRVVAWGASAAAAAILVVLTLPARKAEPPTAGPQAAAAQGERWRYPARALPDEGTEGVVVRGQSVYLLEGSAGEAKIVAVDAGTGRRRWTSKAPSGGHIEAAGERVFCLAPAGAGPGELICLSAEDGRV
ncbi:MAG: zf-HC2 domain-containing protein, partial [Planctomycetota bacterium]|nr:zf-HC2 domain-containing protein [Planctomycetota bacterium]